MIIPTLTFESLEVEQICSQVKSVLLQLFVYLLQSAFIVHPKDSVNETSFQLVKLAGNLSSEILLVKLLGMITDYIYHQFHHYSNILYILCWADL